MKLSKERLTFSRSVTAGSEMQDTIYYLSGCVLQIYSCLEALTGPNIENNTVRKLHVVIILKSVHICN